MLRNPHKFGGWFPKIRVLCDLISFVSLSVRGALLASIALLALPAAAFAEDATSRPIVTLDWPQANIAIIDGLNDAAVDAQRNAAARATLEAVEMPEIAIDNNFTPAQAFDPVNINGIGQIVVDGGGGSVGLCTASLINPRVGLPAVFALTGTDKSWFEASAGIAFGSEKFEVALGADTTIGRSDVSNQSYRGTVTFRF